MKNLSLMHDEPPRRAITIPLEPEDWALIRREAWRRRLTMAELGLRLLASGVAQARRREIERTFPRTKPARNGNST